MNRPVGHVTELMRELQRWAERRKDKNLDVRPLEKSVAYLEEYRDHLCQCQLDWKIKLFEILKCFEEMEGTWFSREWESFGVTAKQQDHIEKEYKLWHERLTSSSHVRNQAESETPSVS